MSKEEIDPSWRDILECMDTPSLRFAIAEIAKFDMGLADRLRGLLYDVETLRELAGITEEDE